MGKKRGSRERWKKKVLRREWREEKRRGFQHLYMLFYYYKLLSLRPSVCSSGKMVFGDEKSKSREEQNTPSSSSSSSSTIITMLQQLKARVAVLFEGPKRVRMQSTNQFIWGGGGWAVRERTVDQLFFSFFLFVSTTTTTLSSSELMCCQHLHTQERKKERPQP